MPNQQIKNNSLSVADVILAVLHHSKTETVKSIRMHNYFQNFCVNKSKKTILSSLSRLKKQGIIERKGRYGIALTEAGAEKALHAFIDTETVIHVQKKHRWDGGWRILFFDIPENKRKLRDYLRKVIKGVGFKELQRSIWIYPGQVPPFLRPVLFRDDLKNHVRFITAGNVDNDEELKTMFNLK